MSRTLASVNQQAKPNKKVYLSNKPNSTTLRSRSNQLAIHPSLAANKPATSYKNQISYGVFLYWSQMPTHVVPGWDYDAFISFSNAHRPSRNFTEHLLTALDKKGIFVYKDNEVKDGGGSIPTPTRVDAIRRSRFAVIVLSVNYASSLTCLDELVEIQNTVGQIALPVFHDVDPSAVRKQSHGFGKAFEEYAAVFCDGVDRVDKWRGAFREVAGRSGWHLHNKSETQCIQEIVEVMLSKLNHSFSNVADELVGIDTRVDELISYLKLQQSGEVRTIAICGVPGIGKTTIARSLRDRIFFEFLGTCFLSNVSQVSKKNGLQKLQRQIMSEIFREDASNSELYDTLETATELKNKLRHAQVLLILDGIDDLKQLEMLAGSQDWFGPGSRIIITATNEDMFRNYEVDAIYEPRELDNDEAYRLLSIKAFHEAYPPEEYVGLSREIVSNAKGIPKVIDDIGSFLYGRSSTEWESTLKRLKENPKYCKIS